MGLGGVAIATLPSVICAKLMFSDGLGGLIQFHSYSVVTTIAVCFKYKFKTT